MSGVDGENFQAHVNFTTIDNAAPTTNRNVRCAPVTRTAEGRFGLILTEGVATRDADIAAFISFGVAGATVNVVKGANDFTWEIQVFNAAAGYVLADLPGAIVSVTIKRVEPA